MHPTEFHENAFKALRLYYDTYHGALECRLTGAHTKDLLKGDASHLKMLGSIRRSSSALKQQLSIEGELPDRAIGPHSVAPLSFGIPQRSTTAHFPSLEAAHFGVPALSSDYPAMREIDVQFALRLTWMDQDDPEDMARQLKHMEEDLETPRRHLPRAEELASHAFDKHGGAYWSVIKEYLWKRMASISPIRRGSI